MRAVGRWALFFILAVIVGGIVWVSPEDFSFDAGDLKSSNKPKKRPVDQIMHGVHLIETSDGKNEWELWADQALSFKGKGSWTVKKVKVIFYSDDGIQFHTTGDRGSVKVNTKDMFIEGNVVTKTSNDYQFLTDAVVYNSARRELNTAHPVTIFGPKDEKESRMQLKGVGMLAQMQNSKVTIHREVQGEKVLDSGRVLKIKSREANLSGKSRKAIFIGNVEMFMDTMTVTGPRAEFLYGEKENMLDSIAVSGGVRVSDENKWATAKTLDISVPKNQYVLNGEPRVVQNNDEIEGDQIILLNGGKQVQVISGRASISDKKAEKEL